MIIIVTVCFVLPLSLLKHIRYLGYTSSLSTLCTFVLAGVVVCKQSTIVCPLFHFNDFANVTTGMDFFTLINSLDNTSYFNLQQNLTLRFLEEVGPQICHVSGFKASAEWAYSIPTMMFAFVCHTEIMEIYADSKSASPKVMQRVVGVSFLVSFVIYCICALFGYLTFYNWMDADLFLMYTLSNSNDLLMIITRGLIAASFLLTVPLLQFAARQAQTSLLFRNNHFSWIRHTSLTFANTLLTLCLVIFIPNIREIFGIFGAISATTGFMLPGMLWIKMDNQSLFSSKLSKAALMLALLGTIVMIQSLVVIVIGYFR